jgi:TatD DNase family protein
MFIDTHAHIYASAFEKDIGAVIEKTLDKGVHEIYMPNIDHTSIDGMLELEAKYPGHCIPMMGLHPCHVNKNFEKELYIVEEWLAKRSFAAVGEMGIDLYWDKTFQSQQEEAFKIQIALAKKYQLPIVIHNRDAFEETISIVEREKDEKLEGIFHCFTGSAKEAQRIMDLGFYMGIGGVVTFKNGGLDKVLPEIGLDSIVLETDSPYLSPVPHRGKRNEPAYIPIIAEKIADCLHISLEEVTEKTTNNANTIFRKWKKGTTES